MVDGHPMSNPDDVRNPWTNHFTGLATPENKPEWNDSVLRSAERDVASILDSCKNKNKKTG